MIFLILWILAIVLVWAFFAGASRGIDRKREDEEQARYLRAVSRQ